MPDVVGRDAAKLLFVSVLRLGIGELIHGMPLLAGLEVAQQQLVPQRVVVLGLVRTGCGSPGRRSVHMRKQ